jgi:hypothetical protein
MNRNFSDYPAPLDYKPNALPGNELTIYGEHPYMAEINDFESRTLPKVDKFIKDLNLNIISSPSSDIQPFITVETEETLDRAISTLSTLKFFFVDTKTHDEYYHIFPRVLIISFIQGRHYEYVFDMENLSPKLIMKLNKVFTDPAITKVCFDSLKKLVPLQRHFSLYFVNLYDSFYNIRKAVMYHISETSKKYNWTFQGPMSVLQLDKAREEAHTVFKVFLKRDLSSACIEYGTRISKHWSSNSRYAKRRMFEDDAKHLFYAFIWFERDMMAKMKDVNPERILSIGAINYLADHYTAFIRDSFPSQMKTDSTFRRSGHELAIKFMCIAADPQLRSNLLEKWLK